MKILIKVRQDFKCYFSHQMNTHLDYRIMYLVTTDCIILIKLINPNVYDIENIIIIY